MRHDTKPTRLHPTGEPILSPGWATKLAIIVLVTLAANLISGGVHNVMQTVWISARQPQPQAHSSGPYVRSSDRQSWQPPRAAR